MGRDDDLQMKKEVDRSLEENELSKSTVNMVDFIPIPGGTHKPLHKLFLVSCNKVIVEVIVRYVADSPQLFLHGLSV
jgi:hypothetical protein